MYNNISARSASECSALILRNTFHSQIKTWEGHRNRKRAVVPSYTQELYPPNAMPLWKEECVLCWTTDICLYCLRAGLGCGLCALGAVALCGRGGMLSLYWCSAWTVTPEAAYGSLQLVSSTASPSTRFSAHNWKLASSLDPSVCFHCYDPLIFSPLPPKSTPTQVWRYIYIYIIYLQWRRERINKTKEVEWLYLGQHSPYVNIKYDVMNKTPFIYSVHLVDTNHNWLIIAPNLDKPALLS